MSGLAQPLLTAAATRREEALPWQSLRRYMHGVSTTQHFQVRRSTSALWALVLVCASKAWSRELPDLGAALLTSDILLGAMISLVLACCSKGLCQEAVLALALVAWSMIPDTLNKGLDSPGSYVTSSFGILVFNVHPFISLPTTALTTMFLWDRSAWQLAVSALAMSANIWTEYDCLQKHSPSIEHNALLKEGFHSVLQVERQSGRIITVRDSSAFNVFRAGLCVVDLLCNSEQFALKEMLSLVMDDSFRAGIMTFMYQAGGLTYCVNCKVVPFAYDCIEDNVSLCIQYMGEPNLVSDLDHEVDSEKVHAAIRSTFKDMEGNKFHELQEDTGSCTQKSVDSVVNFTVNELLDLAMLEDLQLQSDVARNAVETAAEEYDKLMAAISSRCDKTQLRHLALSCFQSCERAVVDNIDEEVDSVDYKVEYARTRMEMRLSEANLQDSFTSLLAHRMQQQRAAASVQEDAGQHIMSYLSRYPTRHASVRRVAMGRLARQVMQNDSEM